jgi:hypothetical protein
MTYSMMTDTAKDAFACIQYFSIVDELASLQLFVIYHGAPLLIRSGSIVSGAVWMRMLAAQSARSPTCIGREMMGQRMWRSQPVHLMR